MSSHRRNLVRLAGVTALLTLLASGARAAPEDPAVSADGANSMGDLAMQGALGSYSMNREASGTAWQPDSSPSDAGMVMAGGWMLMNHGVLNLVYDRQAGPRGDDKAFGSGMLMAMASRSLSDRDTLQFRGMISPEPLMGKGGYPLLLATGETANGVTPLVDRQHPHDMLMEMSATYSHALSDQDSLFIYGGLPGEPSLGPPAFMHRLSAMDSPEAPISHHWLDSTHVSFGVVTIGAVHDAWKIEASRFNAREPDQHRYDIETGSLDSSSARLSWNPASDLSLQVSWGDLRSPEQLEPGVNQKRWTASAIYTLPMGSDGWWSTTAAWGRRTSGGVTTDARSLETELHPNVRWTLFGRAEQLANGELASTSTAPAHVSELSIGAIRDLRLGEAARIGIGALYSADFVPRTLRASYGALPHGAMVFVRVKFGG